MSNGYPLTDFTLEELSALNKVIESHLSNCSKDYHDLKNVAPMTANAIEKNAMMMQDIQVRVLTSFSIVKERNKVESN